MDMTDKVIRQPIIGRRCGKLTVIDRHPVSRYKVIVYCDCGRTKEIYLSNLKEGNTISCGCEKSRVGKMRKTTHCLSKHPLFNVWMSIIKRCENEKDKGYKNYGGRGVKICKEWRNDFKEFYDWAILNGYNEQEQLDIDRFPNNDGDYEPSNCRFTSRKNNQNNRRCTVRLTYKSTTKTLSEWCDILGLKIESVRGSMRNGKDISYFIKKYANNGLDF